MYVLIGTMRVAMILVCRSVTGIISARLFSDKDLDHSLDMRACVAGTV